MTTPKDNRPYFIWDYDLSEDDLRRILAGPDRTEKAWAISRLLNSASWDDIWLYVTPADIQEYWELLTFRNADLRQAWARAFEVWSRTSPPSAVQAPTAPYLAEPAPGLRPGILTPLQQTVLEQFFAYDVGQHFFLTGGTALAGFYLGHRLSDDLDLFTLEDRTFEGLEAELGRLARETHASAATQISTPAYRQVMLTTGNGDRLRLDFVRDIPVQFGERCRVSGVIVDSLLNIAVNKVTAVFGRADIKDFVDLYFLLSQGFDLDALFRLAAEKDRGFTPFYFVTMLRQIHKARRLPVMVAPIELPALIAFYDDLAERLLAEHRPPDARPTS